MRGLDLPAGPEPFGAAKARASTPFLTGLRRRGRPGPGSGKAAPDTQAPAMTLRKHRRQGRKWSYAMAWGSREQMT
jgi:hypothetical protein